jgi:hypothetical protein
MKMSGRKQRLAAIAVVLALFASLMLGSAAGLAVTQQEVLYNGNFEGGFSQIPGCGMVGNGWGCFTNGGSVAYGFYDDQWAPVRVDGAHSQLIEMNTMQPAASQPNRYAGIYQTVNVVRGTPYQFRASGLMREALKDGNKPDPKDDPFRYRVQWGYTVDGSTDWTKVTNWVELPWDKIDNRTSPTGMQSFATSFVAPSDRITIFIRLWKKWGTVYRELDFNVDGVSLWGSAVAVPYNGGVVVIPPGGPKPPVVIDPQPAKPPVVVQPVTPPQPPVVVQPLPVQPAPPTAIMPGACGGPNLVMNGSFEAGFTNGVANYWQAYTNGGRAEYGFYDEMWPPVVKDGAHGQLIEINTKGMALADPNRVAGIYQMVGGLTPGMTYQFTVWGEMREEAAHPGEDPYRYRVQWGYTAAMPGASHASITNWTDVAWDKIYLRTSPGPLQSYTTKFVAPSNTIILAIQGLKKWGTPYRELDVNLDVVQVQGCPYGPVTPHDPGGVIVVPPADKGGVIVVPPGGGGAKPAPVCGTWYTIKKGDTLGAIAARHRTTVAAIAACNNIKNPNLIYIGQRLCIPPG